MTAQLKHIAVSGNIGAGKTALTLKLARHYGWKPLYEPVDENPYLENFYRDMTRWAFHLQLYFLNSRFRQLHEIGKHNVPIIQDRTIYEDAFVFAANLHKSGHISERDYAYYLDVFHSMMAFVQPPDLLIYLQADIAKLAAQIRKRGRGFEDAISITYLENLNAHYERWIAGYTGRVLTLDMNRLDFLANVDDFSFILEKIEGQLSGLFEP